MADHGRFVLDAFAVLAMLGGEPGGEIVQAICADPNAMIWMSVIHLGEVYYILLRRRGETAARAAEQAAREHPNITIVDAEWNRVRAAAVIKAKGGLSFADAFAAAMAREMEAVLVTDDPEYRALEQSGDLRVRWIRPRPDAPATP